MTMAGGRIRTTSGVRWIVCGLLFAAVTLSYVDRQVLSVLKPTLQKEYGWSETGYGNVVFWFQATYGIGYIAFGRFVDRYGARLGYAMAVTLWTYRPYGACAGHVHAGFRAGAHSAGVGRGGHVSVGAGGDDGMVSKTRARLGHRPVQRRRQCGRDPHAADRAHHHHSTSAGRRPFSSRDSFTVAWLVVWLAFYRRPRDHPASCHRQNSR